MPAPVPITIRYGQDPALMGGLSAAAGQAAYDRLIQQQNYDNWLRRRAMDNEFQIAALDRSTKLGVARINAEAGGSPSLMSSASHNRALAQQTGSLTASAGKQKTPLELQIEAEQLRGSKLRNDRTASRGQPGQTVPLETPGRNPSMSMTDRSTGREYSTNANNEIVTTSDGGKIVPIKGTGVTGQPQERVSPQVKAQVDYLDAIKDSVPHQSWQAMRIAAMSGGLKMDQLIDNVRAMRDKTPSDRWMKEASELARVANIPPDQQAAYARQKLHLDEFLYPSDAEGNKGALERLSEHAKLVQAITSQGNPPVQNSGGRTPSGGNPVEVASPEEAHNLPSGTWIKLPDGSLGRVP